MDKEHIHVQIYGQVEEGKSMEWNRLGKRAGMILILFCILAQLWPVTVQANVDVSAQAAILMDVESGRILFEKNSEGQLRIASITKIMTAIVALENGKLTDKVETSSNAYRVEGSSIYLKLGEKLTLEDMLYGLMLRSGNDAAVAIAEHIGESVDGFVFLMNQKAQELGMSKTVFSNPHGLDTHEEHYSTAKDMALLTAYAMKNEDFATIVGTKRKTAPLAGEKWDRIWYNKNKLLALYPYADGVKTGYTKRASRTLVSSATKDGHRLIAVTLNAPNDWNDHINMFEYGFHQYHLEQIAEQGRQLQESRLERGDGHFEYMNDFYYPLKETEKITKKLILHPRFESRDDSEDEYPYPAGFLYMYLDQKEIGRVAIKFVEKAKEETLWSRVKTILTKLLGGS